jgi:hypothetical protein
MASLRDGIVEELRARLAAISGWSVQRLSAEQTSNAPVVALVHVLSETKRARDTTTYVCTLLAGITLLVQREGASATLDDGNPLRYLDRMVVLAEKAVHSGPWANETIATLQGHEIAAPGDENQLEALVRVELIYRHNFNDPETYNPSFVDA